ncbi:MAG: radical SAM family heme chaperone HemW [Deltaproteobacteria bacterium]
MGILGEEELRTVGVYVHCPFCVSKCPYCDFRSVVDRSIPEARYIRCLEAELAAIVEKEGLHLQGRPLESIYLGGGTPSLFSPEAVASIINPIKKTFSPMEGVEVTLEVNPESAERSRLEAFRRAGVNRLSIGIQSLDNAVLAALGRSHTAVHGREAFNSARAAGFDNVGVDLIYGIPGQSLDVWLETVRRVVEMRPEHISAYCLTIEESTPFYPIYSTAEGKGRLPGEDAEIEMYAGLLRILKDAGYSQYEISNFAKPGFEAVHNSRYWLGKDYIGLGSSAHSYLYYPGWGRRWWNEPSPYAYMDKVEGQGAALSGSEELTRGEALHEAVVLGLRMLGRGVDAVAFKKRFGIYPREALTGCDELVGRNLVRFTGEDMCLTDEGALLSNEVFLRVSV